MNFFDIIINKYNNNEIIVSRSGYTGEDGFELSIPNESAENLITHLLKNENKQCLFNDHLIKYNENIF